MVAEGVGATATFPSPVPPCDVAVSVSAALTLGNQSFGDADNDHVWILAGEMLTFTNDPAIPAVIEVHNREAVIANNIVTPRGMRKLGTGTLTLAGTNSASENLFSVEAGALALSNRASLTNTKLAFYDNTALRVDGDVVFWTFESRGTTTIPVSINGTARVGRGYDRDGTTECTLDTALTGSGTLVKQMGNRQALIGPLALTGTVKVAGGTLAVIRPSDIVTWFGFDDPADIGRDSGPAGVTLTPVGTNPQWHEPEGRFGGALKLNGQSYLMYEKLAPLPFLLPVGNAAFSIAAWIKRDPSSNANGGIASWGSMDGSYRSACIRLNTLSTVIQASAGHTAVALDAPDEWQHVALTYDPTLPSGNRKIYVNGVLKRSDVPAQTYTITQAYISIGRGSSDTAHSSGQYFTGLIDEVVIARTALSQAQLQVLMANGAAATFPPPAETPDLVPAETALKVGPMGRLMLGDGQTVAGIDGEAGGIVALANRATLAVEPPADTALNQSLCGAGGLVKKGADTTLTLTSRQRYDGPTTVEAGTLEVLNLAPRVFDGIVAYYTFDDGGDLFRDISGNNIHMAPIADSGIAFQASYGRIGGCVRLQNGTYLEPIGGFPAAMPTGNAPVSVSIWVNPESGMGTSGGFTSWGYTNTKTRSSFNLRFNNSRSVLTVASNEGNVGGSDNLGFDLSTGTPDTGFGVGWHHLCFTHDPTHPTVKQRLYVDGKLYASTNHNNYRIEPVMMRINCGRDTNQKGNSYYDDTIFFNRALTEEEVLFLSAGGRVIPASAPGTATPIINGVVGRYAFDDPDHPGLDTSGYGNHLEPAGGGNLSIAPDGKFGGSLAITAAGSWLTFPGAGYPAAFPSGRCQYTFACWVNPDDDAPSSAGIFYAGSDANLNDLILRFNGNVNLTLETSGTTALNGGNIYNLFAADLPSGWHHVAVTFNAYETPYKRKLFIDGRLLAFNTSTDPFLGTDFFHIGRGRSETSNGFKGRIDEFVVMNRAATLAEIHDLATGMADPDAGVLPARTLLTVAPAARALFRGGSVNRIGGLAGGGTVELTGTSALVIGGATTNRFNGTLVGDSTSRVSIDRDAVQTLPLGAFAGTLTVSNATLQVTAAGGTAPVRIGVGAGGRFGGEGTTAAPVTVAPGGVLLSRSDTPGLTLGGAVTLEAGTIFALEISGDETAGNLKLGGTLALPASGVVELFLQEAKSGMFVVAEAAGGVTGTENLSGWNLVLTGADPKGVRRLKVDGNRLIAGVYLEGTLLSVW
ncbi:MAG TPA: LamG domain-containing protein [Kiritimatiellia bacterium]|nr:LamG domain-containing protein [Kiritimatiellia bacterium]HRU69797.1 LamG domain-containing protein [Kiritimatiellia bacterium]